MIQITSANKSVFTSKIIDVEFILFGKIKCNCEIVDNGFETWNQIK